MKLKFNWGTGIIIAFAIFIGTIGFRIYLAYQRDVDLISEDYYPKGVAYESHLEKLRNTESLMKKVSFKQENKDFVINFPKSIDYYGAKGDILFYFPSRMDKDKKYELKLDKDGIQKINTESLIKGKYIVKLDWSLSGKAFYQEYELFLK